MKYVLDTHTHTVASGHAYSTITENAAVAAKKGLKLMAVTDHAPKMPGSTSYLHFLNLKIIPNEIFGVEILKGAELNILNKSGKVDLSNSIIKKNIDFTIASLHIPCIDPMSIEENTECLINVIKNPHINILGHPGDPRYPFDIEKVIKAAADFGKIIELNNSSLNPNGSRKGGDELIFKIALECKKQNVPVSLGSDAHFCTDIGNFLLIDEIIKKSQLPENLILNTSAELFKNKIAEQRKKLFDSL